MEIRKTCLIFNLMPSPMIQREENIKNAFNIILPEKLINKKILLIDDDVEFVKFID